MGISSVQLAGRFLPVEALAKEAGLQPAHVRRYFGLHDLGNEPELPDGVADLIAIRLAANCPEVGDWFDAEERRLMESKGVSNANRV